MKHLRDNLYEAILALPASLAILCLCYSEFGLSSVSFYAGAYTVLCCAVCVLIRVLRGKDRLILLGAAVILLALPALYGMRTDAGGYHFAHRYIWLLPLIVIACYLTALLCRRFRTVRLLAILAVTGSLVAFLLLHYLLSKLCVMLFLTVALLLFADETQLRWRKEGHTDHALHVTFIAPFVALWLGVSLLFPTSDQPYDWAFIRNIWSRLQDFATSLSQRAGSAGPDSLDTFRVGFADETAPVGSTITADPSVLLLAERVTGLPTSVYLAGRYCDTLDGLQWLATIENSADEYALDTLETRSSFDRTNHLTDYMLPITLRITYRDFVSSYLLAPPKTHPENALNSLLGDTSSGRNLVFDRRRGINTEYTVTGYRMNLRHEQFLEYMKSLKPISEEEWLETKRKLGMAVADLTYERYAEYRQRMKDLYRKPVALSEKAGQFLSDAVGDATDPYERMLLLTEAFNSFTYTTSPGALPPEVTDGPAFLDHFLDTRQGYCAHFATAMVLYAWSEGLPARYVYGFYLPITRDSATEVTGNMAHAWCEIYFEGVGWILFDATPGHAESTFWLMHDDKDAKPWESQITITPSPSPTITPKMPDEPEAETETEPAGTRILRILRYASITLGALALFAILVLLADRILTLRRFRRMSTPDRIRTLARRNLRILAHLDLPIRDDETFSEFRDRARRELPAAACNWISDYEVFLYGTPVDVKSVEASLLAAEETLLNEFRHRKPRRFRLCRLTNRLL